MLSFGPFELDMASYQLRRDGRSISVEPQVLDVIAYLAEHRDRMVRKEELLDEIWGDRFVSESALTSRIKSARQVLGDDGRTQSMIRTVHGRGYQFVPFVTDSDAVPAPTAPRIDSGGDEASAPDLDAALAEARRWFEQAQWRQARERYQDLGADVLDAADLERWGEAAWWTSDIVEGISLRQEAFRRYVAAGDDCAAARVAIALSDDYRHRGSATVALTWFERARSLLATTPGCVETGHMLRMQCNYELEIKGDPVAALATNTTLRELAEALGDADLIAQSLQDHGRVLLALGDVDDGMSMIDRSMLMAATTDTTAGIRGRLYCNMLSACIELGQFRRAMEWTDEALTWCATQGDMPFPGVCEVYRAGLRRRLGELEQALADLDRLATTSQLSNIAGPALLEIGEIHLVRGDVDEAQNAFLQAHAYGVDATVGYAQVAIAEDRPGDAVSLLRDALQGDGVSHVVRRRLLPHLVDAAALAGELDLARSAAEEFARLSETGSDVCRACASRALGAVALLEGRATEARDAFRTAVSLYRSANLPHDLTAAQLGLAAACIELDGAAAARVERDAALATLASIDAVPTGLARLWLSRTADIA